MLDELEEGIERLKVQFDRYFYGVDKVPPVREREKLERAMRNVMRQPFTTTVLRYRFAQLKQRLTTYTHYWNRILNQIEKGTYKRVLAEASRREREQMFAKQQAAEAAAAAQQEPAAAGQKPANGKPRPAPASAGGGKVNLPDGMNAKQARDLFKQFVQAKKAAGENTRGITYGGLVQKLARELPKLQQKHGGKVSFEVTTVNGKVKLRARGS